MRFCWMHYLSSIHPFCVAGYMYIAKVHLWLPLPGHSLIYFKAYHGFIVTFSSS